MPYLIDRQRALWTSDVVAVVSVRQRKIRSYVVLRDNSLYRTLTRARTFLRRAAAAGWTHHKGVRWRERR